MYNKNVLIIGSSPKVGLTFHFTITAIAMKKLGLNVTVVTPSKMQNKILPAMLHKNNIPTYLVEDIDSLNIKGTTNGNIKFHKLLKKLPDKYDIIIAEGINQLLKTQLYKLENRKNRPKFVNIIGSIPPSPPPQIYFKLLDKLTDYSVALCHTTKTHAVQYGLNSNKIIVTPLFSPYLELFDSLKKKKVNLEKYNLNNIEKPTILYAAYHHPWKGFEYYLLSAKEVLKKYDATFILGGTGPLTNKLKKLSQKLGIDKNVIFTGFIPFYDLYSIMYNIVDIGVSTSLKEQFPSYILELMAAEKPIIATNIGGVPEQVFNNFNGFLVDPGDYNAIAKQISFFIENDSARRKMGINSRKIIEKSYNRTKAVQNFLMQFNLNKNN